MLQRLELVFARAPCLQAVQVQPVVVGMYVPPESSFLFYTGGVWEKEQCTYTYGADGKPLAENAVINHAVLIVGYDNRTTTSGKKYWIFKNSYGAG